MGLSDSIFNIRQRFGLNGKEPLVSVILPVFNADRHVMKAIDSVFNQSYTNLELIAVDDASTDGTGQLLQQAIKVHRERLVIKRNVRNCGMFVSVNEGIREAKGDLITLIGSDDVFLPHKIARQVRRLKICPEAWACICKYTRIDEDTGRVLNSRYGESMIMFKRELIKEIGYFDSIRFGGDREFNQRIKAVYGRGAIAYEGRILYLALRREGSLTTSPDSLLHSEIRKTYRKNYKDWHDSQGAGCFMPYPLQQRPFTAPAQMCVSHSPTQG